VCAPRAVEDAFSFCLLLGIRARRLPETRMKRNENEKKFRAESGSAAVVAPNREHGLRAMWCAFARSAACAALSAHPCAFA
jgi:hypothetical protein